MKRDRREWFANPWDGTGMVYVYTGYRGNGTGMEPVERDGTGRDGTGFHFHFRVSL